MTAPSIEEALDYLEAAANWMQRYLDTYGELGDDATQANIDDWHDAVKQALATLSPPAGEGREALVTQVQGILGDKLTVDCLNEEVDGIGPASYAIVDLFLASGLVQDEAGWRDISTAPKDGTEILLFTHHEADEYLDESFDAVQIGWWDDGNHAPGSAFHRDAGWHQQKIGSATHWMPLPAPPIRSARNGGEG